jgi:predicted nucleotidyltransferase
VLIDALQARRQKILEAVTLHARGMSGCSVRSARGDARPNSDIDLLVEIEPGRTLLDLIALVRISRNRSDVP